MDYEILSEYSRFFDERSRYWNMKCNLDFIESIQDHFNKVLKLRGWVFLNELYKCLGLPECKEGQIVGWIYDKEKSEEGHIQILIHKNHFIYSENRDLLLDFNIDGNILSILCPEFKQSA